MRQKMEKTLQQFRIVGDLVSVEPYGNGHINDTFLLEYQNSPVTYYIAQRMNREVFKNPVELMENIMAVTQFLRKEIIAYGGNPNRETLNVIPSLDDKPFVIDEEGEYWRIFEFITDAVCYEEVENPRDFYESGYAFGRFQSLLAEFPSASLHETIVNFHNTLARFERFKAVVAADKVGRGASVQAEIDFVLAHKEIAQAFANVVASGEVPLRVTHNDTKLNNVMMDAKTGKAVCVIDLDTVMPGLAMNDFGDAIRYGASTGAEDELDLSKISCDMELFEAFTQGFIKGCGGRLTQREIELLPMGAKVMTYECGMRFLTDYLEGDVYFKTHREHHNLDRARTQFKLVEDMNQKWQQMNDIVKSIYESEVV